MDPFGFLLFLLQISSFTLTILSRSSRPTNETQNPIEVVRPCGACNESEMVLKQRPVNSLPMPLFIFREIESVTMFMLELCCSSPRVVILWLAVGAFLK